MDNQLIVRTALSDARPVTGEHTLVECALNGKLNLRGNKDNPAFVQAVEGALNCTLPLEANRVTPANEQRVFWLGPDEWLVHLPLELLEEKNSALQQGLSSQHHAITDVSDYFSVIQLSGPQARNVIASASPFDTREPHFEPGQCAQTRFGHASILLWPIDEAPTFGLQVRWSYAQYVYDYLVQSIGNASNLTKFEASR